GANATVARPGGLGGSGSAGSPTGLVLGSGSPHRSAVEPTVARSTPGRIPARVQAESGAIPVGDLVGVGVVVTPLPGRTATVGAREVLCGAAGHLHPHVRASGA